MKYKENGEWKTLNVKASDTLPIGSEVEYNGQTVPDGWEEVTDDILRTDNIKTVQTASDTDTYSCSYLNEAIQEGNVAVLYVEPQVTTYAEISAAYDAGWTIILKDSGGICAKQNNIFYFNCTWYTGYNDSEILFREVGVNSSNVWTSHIQYLQPLVKYSTTRRWLIGTWTDGTPVYRGVYTGTLADGDVVIDLHSLSINEIVNIGGSNGSNGNYRPMNFYYAGNSISTRYCDGYLYINSSSAYAGEPFKVIVDYT